MMRNILTVALSALTLVSAQFTINPAEVLPTTRVSWCQGETHACTSLCGTLGTQPLSNACDLTTLAYNCTCSNGSAPGLQYYTNTMPTYICLQAYADCQTANVASQQAQENCTVAIFDKCGTLNPNNVTIASPTTASSSIAPSGTASGSASASSSAPTSSSSSGALPTAVVQLGNGAALAAVGLFAYML